MLRIVCVVLVVLCSMAASAESLLDDCLEAEGFARVARLLDPEGRVVYARVLEDVHGHVSRAATLADGSRSLSEVFALAADPAREEEAFDVSDDRVCSVVDLPESALDDESSVIVSTGLNYAAHADEAGGGDVFLFPKPASPTSPYARVAAPAGVLLLDYEVELAYVLLEDIDLTRPISRDEFLSKTAFFLSNDVSDREPIISMAAFSGPSLGFAEGKGQPGFFPAGPWMVRGTELFGALEACGGGGLGLRLAVDAGDETEMRQSATTALMIVEPWDLIAYLGDWITEHGRRSPMPFVRDGVERFYPLAIGDERPILTAGSLFQTGTPEGVALNAPDGVAGLTLRGLIRLRSPFAQFLVEERERVEAGGTLYLAPGDEVLAEIDGLGAQDFIIGEPGSESGRDPCRHRDTREGMGES